jgi:hypothetical protein
MRRSDESSPPHPIGGRQRACPGGIPVPSFASGDAAKRGEGLKLRTVTFGLSAIALGCFSQVAQAQIIAPDSQPAQTVDNLPGIVLDAPVKPSSGLRISLQLASSANYSSNILGVSNLPGGLELPDEGGIMWDKGATAIALLPVSGRVLLYAKAGISHTNYFEHSRLNYFELSGGVGGLLALSGKTRLAFAFDCASERNSDFHQYYSICRPSVGFTTAIGNPYGRTGLELGVRGALGLGSEDRFARYREASAWLNFEAGKNLRFQLRPEARVRDYDVPASLALLGDQRKDYQASVRLALFYQSDRFTFGVAAVPRANWSDMAQYRYWEVQGGPFLRVRI